MAQCNTDDPRRPRRGGWRANPLAEFDEKEADSTVGKRFESVARLHGDRLAFQCGGERLTYRQLDSATNRLARRIIEVVGAANEPVAVLLRDGVATAIAMIAALKAGKIYAPLDAAYPAARLEYMIDDTQARIVVTDSAHLGLAGKLCGKLKIINLDDTDPGISDEPVDVPLTPDAISNILYTSGSAGEPKGVYNTHRQLLHGSAVYGRMMDLRASDRMAGFMSFAFAGGMKVDLWGLLHGTANVSGSIDNLDQLAEFFVREEISGSVLSPSLFKCFLAGVRNGRDFTALRILYIGGEPLRKPEVTRFRELFPRGVTLLNVLAMTEVGSVTQFAANEADDTEGDLVPVGYELGDVEILLLDDNRNGVKRGEVGQIAARSRHIALGYWRKDEATKAAFLEDTDGSGKRTYLTGDLGKMFEDGCLVHLGRKDLMVKVRGYRIETAEVEAALCSHNGVRDAAVTAREDRPGDQRLVAYIVPSGSDAPSAAELRRFLSMKLPEYMVPGTYVILDALPLNQHGKVDRRALPAPRGARPRLKNAFVNPRTPIERRLSVMWADLLGIDAVGVDDDFFELGGHSLLAAQAVSRINEAFGVKLGMQELFLEPTVGAMAVAVTQQLAAGVQASDLERMIDELEAK